MDQISGNNQVKRTIYPKGSPQEYTDIYVITDYPNPEDLESGYPLSGQSGTYFFNMIAAYGKIANTRVHALITDEYEDYSEVVQSVLSYDSKTSQYSENLYSDINECNPKVVVGLGAEVCKYILRERFTTITGVNGNVYDDVNLGGRTYTFVPLVSPTYVLNQLTIDPNSEISTEYAKLLYKVVEIANGTYVDIMKTKNIMSALTYQELLDIYDTELKEYDKLSYDIETNAAPIYSADSEIIGYSLGRPDKGVYACMRSLEYDMSDEDIQKCLELLTEVLKTKNVIVHNSQYERPYTLTVLGYEIPFETLDDTLIMARLMNGASTRAGLKVRAQQDLGYPDWETDLEVYMKYLKVFLSCMLGAKKNQWVDVKVLREYLLQHEEDCQWTHDNNEEFRYADLVVDHGFSLYQISEIDTTPEEVYSTAWSAMEDILLKYYSEEEIRGLLAQCMSTKLTPHLKENSIPRIFPYNYIPMRLLCKYGAIDSIATYDLSDHYFDRMDNESTDDVKLREGYKVWLEHIYAGYTLEKNGAYWNEELVSKDEIELTQAATKSLREMLLSPLLKESLEKIAYDKYLPLLLSDYFPEIPVSQGYVVSYDRDTSKYSVIYNGKRVARARINDIVVSQLDRDTKLVPVAYDMIVTDINNAKDYAELKVFYNPASSTQGEIAQSALISEDLHYGYAINSLYVLSKSPEYEDIQRTFESNPEAYKVDIKLMKMVAILKDDNKLKEDYGDQWSQTKKKYYQCIKEFMQRFAPCHPDVLVRYNGRETIESYDDETIIRIYEDYLTTGIDPDNPDTWSEVFKWLINFRIFKKTIKIINSYILGTVGRSSVRVVDKESMARGDKCVIRKRPYYDEVTGEPNELQDGEGYVVASKFGVATATTGRWQSGFHTIPWGSQVKRYYTSRFKGGTIFQPDYSQMEVRTLAATSKEPSMMQAFIDGADIHRMNAAKIWGKKPEDVTDAERRFSKMGTFSLLYGADERSFAKNFLNGDYAKAHEIYESFFQAFPIIKDWIATKHKEAVETNRVGLMTNRFIYLKPEDDSRGALESMLRKAQNFPIQGGSADITGCILYEACKYIDDHEFKSKPFLYVHDSIEIDIYPYELIEMIATMDHLLQDRPMERFGIPSKCDFTLGDSLGSENEVDLISHNDEFTQCVLTLSGTESDIRATIENWKLAYKTVDILEEEWGDEKMISIGENFIVKRSYQPNYWTMSRKGKVKVEIKYYE